MFYAPGGHARRARDFYPTPPDLARALLRGLGEAGIPLPVPVFDPCAGDGGLLAALRKPGFGSDRFPDAYPARPGLLTTPIDAGDPGAISEALGASKAIVTNPPYGRHAARIVKAGLDLVDVEAIELAAFLMPLPWEAAGSPSRLALMRSPLFTLRIVCCWRPEWIEGTNGGGKMNFVWLVWTASGRRFPLSVYVGKERANAEERISGQGPRRDQTGRRNDREDQAKPAPDRLLDTERPAHHPDAAVDAAQTNLDQQPARNRQTTGARAIFR